MGKIYGLRINKIISSISISQEYTKGARRNNLDDMNERKELFRSSTKTRKALHLTMVTTYGIKSNAYSGMIQSEVTLDDLFIEFENRIQI